MIDILFPIVCGCHRLQNHSFYNRKRKIHYEPLPISEYLNRTVHLSDETKERFQGLFCFVFFQIHTLFRLSNFDNKQFSLSLNLSFFVFQLR